MPAPVLLHGFTGSSASWGDALVDALASAHRAPILVDAPGHGGRAGETDPGAFTAARVRALVDEAAGWSGAHDGSGAPFPLVGYSMGGRLALSYAVAHPERVSALVLESASPGLETSRARARRRAADEALAARLERDGIEPFVDRWEALPLFESRGALPAAVQARQRALRLRNDPRSLAAALRGLGTGVLPSYWDALPGLDRPVLLLVGALDRKFVDIAGRMETLLPRAELRVVPGAGHTVHLERPDAWVEAVVGFLARHA